MAGAADRPGVANQSNIFALLFFRKKSECRAGAAYGEKETLRIPAHTIAQAHEIATEAPEGRPASSTIQLRNTSQYVPAARNAAHNLAASAWVSAPIRTRAAPMSPKIPRMTTCGSRSATIVAYLERHSR